jgi:hypothetical protein
MNIFKQSSQYRNWLFHGQDNLDKQQLTKFERGLKIIAELNKDLQGLEIIHHHDIKDNKDSNKGTQQKISVNLKSIRIFLIYNRDNSAYRRKGVYNLLHKSNYRHYNKKDTFKESQNLRLVIF